MLTLTDGWLWSWCWPEGWHFAASPPALSAPWFSHPSPSGSPGCFPSCFAWRDLTTCPAARKLWGYMSKNARHPLHIWNVITILHKCNSSCVCSDVDFCRVPICRSGWRSSDDPLKSQHGQSVSVHESDDWKMACHAHVTCWFFQCK